MLRVARKGVIFIEPTDRQIESRYAAGIAHGWQFFVRTAVDALKRRLGRQPWQPEVHYESAGNYVYTVSPREMEKVCLGLNLPWLATRGMCDHYEPGYETELAEEGASAGSGNKFVALRSRLRKAEDRARRGLGAWGLHTVVLGVAELEGDVERGLRQAGFEVKRLERNPWVHFDRLSNLIDALEVTGCSIRDGELNYNSASCRVTSSARPGIDFIVLKAMV